MALAKRALRDKGLPDAVLATLKRWLANHPEPTVLTDKDEKQHRYELREGPKGI
jgi:hypothetical protein